MTTSESSPGKLEKPFVRVLCLATLIGGLACTKDDAARNEAAGSADAVVAIGSTSDSKQDVPRRTPKVVRFERFFERDVLTPPKRCEPTGMSDDWPTELGSLTRVCALPKIAGDETGVYTEFLQFTNAESGVKESDWLRAYAVLPKQAWATADAERSFLSAFEARYGSTAPEPENADESFLGQLCRSGDAGAPACITVVTSYEPERRFRSSALAMLNSYLGMRPGSFHVVTIENKDARERLDQEIAKRRTAAAKSVVK